MSEKQESAITFHFVLYQAAQDLSMISDKTVDAIADDLRAMMKIPPDWMQRGYNLYHEANQAFDETAKGLRELAGLDDWPED